MHICICIFAVYTECEISRCENGGTCRKLGVSYICDCLDDYTGSLCETYSKIDVVHMYYIHA